MGAHSTNRTDPTPPPSVLSPVLAMNSRTDLVKAGWSAYGLMGPLAAPAVKTRTKAANQIHSLVVTAPEPLKAS